MDLAPSFPYSLAIGPDFERHFGVKPPMQRRLIQDGKVESFLLGEPRGRRHILVHSYLRYVEQQRHREAAGELGLGSPNPGAYHKLRKAAVDGEAEATVTA